MPITWRRELYFECDNMGVNQDDTTKFNPNCYHNLALDQLDHKTRRGMFAIAKKIGWTWDDNYECLCPSCSEIERRRKTFDLQPTHTTGR